MKVLAGKKNADCYEVDTKITAIQHSIQEPSDEIKQILLHWYLQKIPKFQYICGSRMEQLSGGQQQIQL